MAFVVEEFYNSFILLVAMLWNLFVIPLMYYLLIENGEEIGSILSMIVQGSILLFTMYLFMKLIFNLLEFQQ